MVHDWRFKKQRHFLYEHICKKVSAVIGLVGIYLAATHWRSPSALVGKEAYITFGVIVATECLFAGVGAALLAKKKKPAYIPAWIAFVVGVHFLPLAWLFNDPWLYALTALASGAPVAAVAISRKTKVAISALTGLFMGLTLLAFGLRGLYVFFA